MKKQLSLPVAAISKVAPKYKAHGTAIERLLPASVVDSLGTLKAEVA